MSPVDQLVTLVGGIIGTVSGAIAAVVAVLAYRHERGAKTSVASDDEQLLTQTASQLAHMVQLQWREEENRRRIHDPFPLPVRWVNAPDELFDHWPNITLRHKAETSSSVNLSGRLECVNEIFDRIPSKRIVVLGKAGSGKTILALRYVLDALDRREDNEPVPVVLDLASWNPVNMSLRDWLCLRLIEEYPGLGASAPHSPSLAAALVDTGRIVPVLDGFDELAKDLQPSAITALNITTSPFILTSRPAEYQAAVDTADVISAAAGVSILDLTIDDLADYLPRTTRKIRSDERMVITKWDPVLEYLRHHSDASDAKVVQAVLSTPLMVGLARAIYSDTKSHDPSELLGPDRSASVEMLEDYLLDAFVPAVYQHQPHDQYWRRWRRRYSAEDAQRWLENLAVHLRRLGSRDLAWWQLGDTISLPGRLLVGGVIGVVGGGVFLGLIWRFGASLGLGFGAGIAVNQKGRWPLFALPRLRGRERQVAGAVIGGVLGGFTGGLTGGLSLGLTGSTRGLVLGALTRQTNGSGYSPTVTIATGLAAGLVLSTAAWSGIRREFSPRKGILRNAPEWIERSFSACLVCLVGGLIGGVALGLAGGLVLGISCGAAAGLMIGLETYIDLRTATSPLSLLSTDRRNAIFASILYGLTSFLAVLAASWEVIGPIKALTLGVGSGLTLAFGICLAFYAWGHWVTFTRGWLPLTGRLPFTLLRFLIDAHQRGVLRQAGAVYQFRHARLQDRLAERRLDGPPQSVVGQYKHGEDLS